MTTIYKLQLENSVISYTVKRSRRRRKTVQIIVSDGAVMVSAPMHTPNREIQDIVKRRGGWILDKLETESQGPPPLGLVSGDALPYLGRELTLIVEESDVRKPSAHLDSDCLVVVAPSGLCGEERRESVQAALVTWYRARAGEILTDSVSLWLSAMGRTEMPRVLVREQKTRWGSCSADGTLRFSWRLAMVEHELIDSVAVHELAHLEVMNHSPAFWDVVLRAMPDAKDRRKRLAEAGRNLPL